MLGAMNTQRGHRTRAWVNRAGDWSPKQLRNRSRRAVPQANQQLPSGGALPTNGGHGSYPRGRPWALLVAGLLVAIGATSGILRLHADAAQHGRAKVLLARVESHARHLSAVEWEQIAEQQLPGGSELEEDPVPVEAELVRTVEELRRLRETSSGIPLLDDAHADEHTGVQAVQDTHRPYQQAAWAQFQQLAAGKVSEAADLDEPRQLRDPDLSQRVADTLSSAGLEPGRLTLEITETSMVDDLTGAGAALATIRDLGVRVAIDDFGIGFSALASLKTSRSTRSRSTGPSSTGWATTPKTPPSSTPWSPSPRPSTAEGIETAGQLQQLQALGCDHGQGYYVAKPLQPGSVQPFLDTHRPPSPGTDRKRMAPSAPGLQRR
jgi:EAL domain-containing protein (putative c-di-GMP-specific phosphodiesterase class I)